MTDPALIERITRSLAFMLRHQPEAFDLELDPYGFADLDDVVHALNERLGEPVEEEDVQGAVRSGDRPRYEIQGDRIRALYGHSIPVDPGPSAKPPEFLFVAVPEQELERARRFGLRGGRRRFLHLALTRDDACESGRRAARDYAVLQIRALDAWEEGISFYDRVALWLAEEVPTNLIELEGAYHDGTDPVREFGGPRERGPRDRDAGRGPGRGPGEGRGRGRRGRGGRGRGRDRDQRGHGHEPREARDGGREGGYAGRTREEADGGAPRASERFDAPAGMEPRGGGYRDQDRPSSDERSHRMQPADANAGRLEPRREPGREPRFGGRDEGRDDRSQGRPERGERMDRGDRPPERGDRHQDRGGRPDRGERPDRGDRSERGDRPDRGDRGDRNDRGDRPMAGAPRREGGGFGAGLGSSEPREERRPAAPPPRPPSPPPRAEPPAADKPGFGAGL